MDPGIGLMVNSMVPPERRIRKLLPKPVPKPPPYLNLNLPPGFLDKPHVRHALKYMTTDEEREATLAAALKWKKIFDAKKWPPVVSAIQTARNEDHVRCPVEEDEVGDDKKTVLDLEPPRSKPVPVRSRRALGGKLVRPGDVGQATVRRRVSSKSRVGWREVGTQGERPRGERTPVLSTPLTARSVWRDAGTHGERTPLASTPGRFRWEVGASGLTTPFTPHTPRQFRWDVLTPGPRTPLSTAPSVNSFSNWIKPKPAPPEWGRSTPVQATYYEPGFGALPSDVESCEVYLALKKSIETLARKRCLSRFQARSLAGDFIPATMIRPNDMLQAAQLTMTSCRIKSKHIITKDLPERIRRHAAGERELRGLLCINTQTQLREQARWINHMSTREAARVARLSNTNGTVNEPLPVISILEQQRDILRILRKQRERAFLTLSPAGLEAAWAVKITEDMERLAGSDSDSDWSDSDDDIYDEGYSYGNILRNIKSEMNSSSSSSSLASMLSDTDLTLRSRSNTQTSTSSQDSKRDTSPRWSGSTVTNNSSSPYPVSTLAIVAQACDADPSTSSPLTPQDREFRHRGPALDELDHWAQELRKMETTRAERRPVHPLHRGDATASLTPSRRIFVDTPKTHSRFSSSSSSSSAGTAILHPLPRPPASLLSVDTRPTILDHEYHQRKLGSQTHSRKSGETSQHDSMRPLGSHVRASSRGSGKSTGSGPGRGGEELGSVQVRARSVPKQVADEWVGELERMESREKERQASLAPRADGEGRDAGV